MADDVATIAELRAKLAEEERKRLAAEERQRAAEEKQRVAEETLDVATRRTTLREYLDLYQSLCASELRFDPDCRRNTKGGVTNPRDRITPTIISPWIEFDNLQINTYQEVCDVLQAQRLFPNEADIKGARGTIQDFLITSELALTSYINGAEVPPIKEILLQFIAFGSGDRNNSLGVSFTPRGDPEEDTKGAFAPVDGLWNRGEQGSNRPITLVELKPPHKLTVSALQSALDDSHGRAQKRFETRPVINSPHAENDSTYVITAVFTQVFDYMIETGMEYAYVNTGMACVFFQILETEPTVLHYSLYVSPRTDRADPEKTAVCQIALFLCRCLTARQRDQDWIRSASESTARFRVDPEAQLDLMSSPVSSTPDIVTPDKEDYKPPRKRRKQNTPPSDRPPLRRTEDSDHDADFPSPTPNRRITRLQGGGAEGTQRSATSSSTTSTEHRQKDAGTYALIDKRSDESCTPSTYCVHCDLPKSAQQYCTEACLQGLTNHVESGFSRALDMACPNANRHSSSSEHELTTKTFCGLLRRQLARSCVHATDRLKIRGKIGHLFRITLCSHGYTFVAKAVRSEKLPALAHEFAIYEKLRPLQAQYIPVCLGLVQLEIPYYLPFPNHLTHFLLLSYSGTDLSSRTCSLLRPEEVALSAEASLMKLHDYNVRHRDVRRENMLWNTKLHRVFMIDFESSDIVSAAPRSPPQSCRNKLSIRNRAIVSQASSHKRRKRELENEEPRQRGHAIDRQVELAAAREEIMPQLAY